jgi:hypothetical protein
MHPIGEIASGVLINLFRSCLPRQLCENEAVLEIDHIAILFCIFCMNKLQPVGVL